MASMRMKTVLTVFCLFLFPGCMALPSHAARESGSTATDNAFALDLYARLAEAQGNIFFSPASIQIALAMAYAGARGHTAAQMAAVLHVENAGQGIHAEFRSFLQQLDTPRMIKYYVQSGDEIKPVEGPAYELVIANALWGQQGYPWDRGFLDMAAANYGAGLQEVDFAKHPEAARRTINGWVEEKTRDRIKDLIVQGSISPMMRLILTNAIYFKAAWNNPFADHATQDLPFHVSETHRTTVPMMTHKEDFKYLETDTFQALELPYKADELAMIAFLPKSVNGLGEFERTLSPEALKAWMAAFHRESVEMYFPKFAFTSSFSLSSHLTDMGMREPFSPTSADFSGMTTAERIFISEVIHKAFVAVDEEGTTAAAATAVMMVATAMPMPKPEPKVFRADHPFLFCVRHTPSGKILFMGRFAEPETR